MKNHVHFTFKKPQINVGFFKKKKKKNYASEETSYNPVFKASGTPWSGKREMKNVVLAEDIGNTPEKASSGTNEIGKL